MEILEKISDRNLLLECRGELDHHAARDAMRQLELALDAALPHKLVLDLGGVTFMDSSGIALLLRSHRHVTGYGGALRVVNIPTQPRRVLDAAGVGRIITLE